MMMKLRW